MTSKQEIEHGEAGYDEVRGSVTARLATIVEQAMDAHGLVGLGVGIVKDGAVWLAQGYGKRSVTSREPSTARTLFHMASVSKPFVATGIMQLWEAGRLDLEAPVTTYLPYFALQGGASGQITIRHLMSHTGGVPDTEHFAWHQPEYDDEALERYVRSLAAEKMVAAPGERFSYSNPAYEVLGDVIAKVAGQPFEAYVKSQVLDPLGMRDSTFLRAEVAAELATTPHFGAPPAVLPGAYPYNRAHAPSSTLHSSAADMCRWALANLAHGALDGRRILAEASHELLWHPEVVTGEKIWNEVHCLGWSRGTYRGRAIVHHSGADPGYFADLVLLPELQLGVVVMANAYCATAWAITDAALDLMLGLEPSAPRRPITVPVGLALQTGGVEAAVAEHRRLQVTAADDYDFDERHYHDAAWGAVEMKQPSAAMPLLEVWVALFPASANAWEWLGRAHLASGDPAAAAASWQTALELDPESETIIDLLKHGLREHG